MRLNRWIETISLKRKFTAIFILAAVIPIVVTTAFIINFIELDAKARVDSENRFRNQVKFNVILALRSLAADTKLFSHSNPFLDFLTVPSNLRVYAENRLFGLAHEVTGQSQLKPSFSVFDLEGNEIFKSSRDRKPNFSIEKARNLKNGFIINAQDQAIYYISEIKYDDQQLQGPTARLRGYLAATVDISELKANIPELKEITKLEQDLKAETIEFEMQKPVANKFSMSFFIILASMLLVVAVLSAVFFVNKSILIPISKVTDLVLSQSEKTQRGPENEIEFLNQAIKTYQKNIKRSQDELVEQSKLSTLVSIASQVAHDIRSPLTALNIVIETLNKLPEDKRIIVRSATQRINDIANDLLARGKSAQKEKVFFSSNSLQNSEIEELSVVMVSSLVDLLVSEKRIQFREKIAVSIDLDLSKSYGLFASILPNEFTRMLSNLINNSVEALNRENGKIIVNLRSKGDYIMLEVSDNGVGIPPEVLDKLGTKGYTYGKNKEEAGSGLGLYHARTTVEKFGGQLNIESKNSETAQLEAKEFKISTTIRITFPKAVAPSWFVSELKISKGTKIIVLDDDQSIHSVWRGRISSLSYAGDVEVISFTSSDGFKNWVRDKAASLSNVNVIYLVDYELLGQKQSGLDVIDELGISNFSILVTSRYDEANILERCNRLGIKVVPKAMAGLLPIEVLGDFDQVDAVLIDDDELVASTWKMSARRNKKKILSFKSPSEFFSAIKIIPKSTPIYIDSNLGEKLKGEVVAKDIYFYGFENIHVTTGYDAHEIQLNPYIKSVLGKSPIWN